METNSTYHTELIAKYFAGETTSQEADILAAWISESDQNKQFFDEYRQTWLLIEQTAINKKINVDHEWNEVSGKLSSEKLNIPITQSSAATAATAATDAHKLRLLYRKVSRYAAVMMIFLTISALAYYYIATPKMVIIAAGNTSLIQKLPDGTIVTLNAGSKLEYPEKFSTETRNVHLKGEAYFQVTHDVNHPFIVAANQANIEVLGTSFNVNTGSINSQLTILLTEGKVSVYLNNNPKQKTILLPGEKAEVKDKLIHKSAIEDVNYMAWKTGLIVFDNTNLEQIATTLSKVYRTTISISPELKNCTITASFNNQSLASVLHVIKTTLDLQVIEKNNSFEITGKPCR